MFNNRTEILLFDAPVLKKVYKKTFSLIKFLITVKINSDNLKRITLIPLKNHNKTINFSNIKNNYITNNINAYI